MPLHWVLVVVSPLFGQAQYGSISGRVADTTGAVVPGIRITLVNAETGQGSMVLTAADGTYQVPQVLPGTYNLITGHQGFKRLQINGLKLDISQNLSQDVVLEVGAVTETVNVQGSALMIETVSGSVGHVVENKEILELPLNGRNVFDLVNLTVTKNIRIGERYRLQFRWEAFNTTNTPAFGPPGSGFGGAGFGVAAAGASDREMQFALKLYY